MNEPYSLVHIRRIDLCAVFSQILTMSWHICRGAFHTHTISRGTYMKEPHWPIDIRRVDLCAVFSQVMRRIHVCAMTYCVRIVLNAPRYMCHDIVITCGNTAHRSMRRVCTREYGSFIYVCHDLLCAYWLRHDMCAMSLWQWILEYSREIHECGDVNGYDTPPAPMNHVKYLRAGLAEMPF